MGGKGPLKTCRLPILHALWGEAFLRLRYQVKRGSLHNEKGKTDHRLGAAHCGRFLTLADLIVL